jgi:endoglucanase Acf2
MRSIRGWCALLLGAGMVVGGLHAQTVSLGQGAYAAAPLGRDKPMPRAPHRVAALLGTAAQTNQWYSTLLFNDKPEPIYAQPLSVRPTRQGLEIALPRKQVVPTVRQDTEIHYPHQSPLVVSPTEVAVGQSKLAKTGDWSIEIEMGEEAGGFSAAVARGWPYVHLEVAKGDLKLQWPSAATVRSRSADGKALVLESGGTVYGLYGPSGVRWQEVSPSAWVAQMPQGKGRLAVAALPNGDAAMLDLFAKHAYAKLTDTRVAWQYDEARARVTTRLSASTRTWEGPDHGPLLALYPHHWHNNARVTPLNVPPFDTVRGALRLLAASSFEVENPYHGFVPFWPGVTSHARLDDLSDVMKSDRRTARRMMLQQGEGPYWQGKGLQRTVKLADVFEQQGDAEGAAELRTMARERMERWLSAGQTKGYFQYDAGLGAVAGYPDEFFSVAQINDHHFTFGYWIRTAAELGLRDPKWASKERWGGMIDLLVADLATTERGGARFPFLRTFDPYEGHSWASGVGLGEHGNNQESSSEAVNAWVGLILWGELTGDRALRDLGVYLFTSEIQAIQHYWFDVHGLVLPPEYKNVDVAMLFGAKYAHNTWWTDEPRQITGINLLPITTASTYLAQSPEYVQKNLRALGDEEALYGRVGKRPSNPPPRDVWQDVFAKYRALVDAPGALDSWNRWGAVETGASRTHTLHHMMSLDRMGRPDFSIQADTPLYAVFQDGERRRIYLAYNATNAPKTVRFSNGKTLAVEPRSLAQARD